MGTKIQVYDLFDGRDYTLDSCDTTFPVGDYLPVRSKQSHLWYAFDLKNKKSVLIHRLEEDLRLDILEAIYQYETKESERNAEQ